MKRPNLAHLHPGDTRLPAGKGVFERTAAELRAMQPTEIDRRRGRTRRRLEEVLERRALARELGD